METDAELLRQYVRSRNEAAFTELVRRHINLVFATACRGVGGDVMAAEDVTQLVFIELVRKASSLTQHPALAGWLYTSVRHVSANLRRAQQRHAAREQSAQFMNEPPGSQTRDSSEEHLGAILDDALHELNEGDRGALVLRYLEGNSLRQVGAVLGLTEDAARMRVDRALEKLRTLLAKRHVTSTASGITGALAAAAALQAPSSLAAAVTTIALADATISAAGTTWLGLTIMTKLKLGVISAMMVAGVTTPLVFQHRSQVKLRQENQSLRQQADQLAAANDQFSKPAPQTSNPPPFSDNQFRELLRLRGEVTTLRRQQDDLVKQIAAKVTSPAAQQKEVDTTWVQQVLNSPPKDQGAAAGLLRGKVLRREMTNISPSEVALQDALLQRQLNQTLERSPTEFADFQTAFIQAALAISDETKIQQMRDILQKTYEQAVANGLDIPSKPATDADTWVQRRFRLDRQATAQLKQLFTQEERTLFDRAFLGVMGIDLGGVGVDKSNYPKGFLAPE